MTFRQYAFALCILLLPAVTCQAAIVTWSFSGTYQPGFGPPLTDFMPNLAAGDGFTGTLSYDTSAAGIPYGIGGTQYIGQPLSISVLFDNEYLVELTSIQPGDNVRLENPGFISTGAFFDKWSVPGTPTPFDPSVVVETITIGGTDSEAVYPTPGLALADLDLSSTEFDNFGMAIRLRGPSPFPPFAEEEVFAELTIDQFTLLSVPEPGTWILASTAFAICIFLLPRKRLVA